MAGNLSKLLGRNVNTKGIKKQKTTELTEEQRRKNYDVISKGKSSSKKKENKHVQLVKKNFFGEDDTKNFFENGGYQEQAKKIEQGISTLYDDKGVFDSGKWHEGGEFETHKAGINTVLQYAKKGKEVYKDNPQALKMMEDIENYYGSMYSDMGNIKDMYSQYDNEDDFRYSQMDYDELNEVKRLLDIEKGMSRDKDKKKLLDKKYLMADEYALSRANSKQLREEISQIDLRLEQIKNTIAAESVKGIGEHGENLTNFDYITKLKKEEGNLWNRKDRLKNLAYNAETEEKSLDLVNLYKSKEDFINNSSYDKFVVGDVYRYINGDKNVRKELINENQEFADNFMNANDPATAMYVQVKGIKNVTNLELYDYLTEDEKRVYNYKKKVEGEQSAFDYLKKMEPVLNKRYTQYKTTKLREFTHEHPIIGSVASVGTNVVSGVGFVEDLFKKVSGQEIDPYSDAHRASHYTTAIRGQVKEDIDSQIGDFAYDVVMGLADLGVELLVSKGIGKGVGVLSKNASLGKKATTVSYQLIVSSGAATSTVIEAKDRGLSDWQAIGLGTSAAVIEALTEKVSIEALLSNPRNVLKAAAKNFVAEGSEEMASAVLNKMADVIIAKDQSTWRTEIRELMMNEGLSEAEAFAKVFGETAMEVGYEGLVGAFVGAGMGSGTAMLNLTQTGNSVDSVTVKELINLANPKSESGKAAEKVKTKPSAINKGKLVTSLIEEGAITEEDLQKRIIRNRAIKFYENAGKTDPDVSIRTVIDTLNPEELGISTEEAVEAISTGIREGRKAQAENVEERFEDESGIEMEKDFENYPYDEQTVLKEYINSTNLTLLEKLRKFKANKKAPFERVNLSKVNPREVADVKRLTGAEVDGYIHAINSDTFVHIENRHGEKGKHDNSMANLEDVARVEYVLENYDSIEVLKDEKGNDVKSIMFNNKENSPSPLLLYSKKINGTYYTVVAAAENKYKKLWVVTSYIGKNKEDITQALHDEISSLRTTSETAPASLSSENSISQNQADVKKKDSTEDYTAEVSKRIDEAEKEKSRTVAQIYRDVRTGKIGSAGSQGAVAYVENTGLVEKALAETGTSENMTKREADTVFAVAYTAGLNGETFDAEALIKTAGVNPAVLSQPGVINSLKLYHMAGISDINAARNVKYWGANSGLQKDDTYRKALRKFRLSYDVAGKLDALGKIMGHKVILVENLKNSQGESANAVVSDSNGTIKINLSADNPILNGAIHEIVHSIRKTDPASYNKLANIVLEVYNEDSPQWKHIKDLYKNQLKGKSEAYASDYVSEETVCKALGAIMQDSEMLNEFVQKDKNLAKRILKGLHDLIVRVNAWASGDAKISAEQKKTFSKLEKELRAFEGILFEALNKRARVQGGVENAVEGDTDNRYDVADGEAKLSKAEKNYLDIINKKFNATVENYKKMSGGVYQLGKTPSYLKRESLEDIQLEVTPSIIEKAVEKHNIPVENLKNLVYEVQVPVMAFPSISENVKEGTQNIVVLTNIKNAEGKPVVCSIVLDAYHYKVRVDRISSIQRKDNIESFLERSLEAVTDKDYYINGKSFLYVDIKKTNEWLTAIGLQSPKLINAFRSLSISVPYFESLVKTQNGDTKYSMQKDEKYSTDERSDLADTEYLELAKDPVKNKAELEKMVEEAAKEAGYTTPKVFHGTAEIFTVFLKSKFGSNTGAPSSKKAIFFTNSRNVAEGYAMDARPERVNELYRRAEKLENQAFYNGKYEEAERAWEEYEEAELLYKDGGRVMDAYLKVENPLIYDFKGEDFREKSFDDLINQALRDGKDGVIFKNVYDGSNRTHDDLCDVYAVFDSNQVKSADPVTYDDDGNIIPLSERFNAEKEDIRWDLADVVDNSSDDEYNISIENNEPNGIDDAVCIIPRQDIVFVGMYRSLVRKKGFKEKLLKAKQGELEATRELLETYINDEYIDAINKKYSDVILVPVVGHQDTTENKLPLALANAVSTLTDVPVYKKIYKLTSNNMKSKSSNVRLTSKMDFDFYEDGTQKDIAGKHFVLVDDVVSTGTTLTALRDFIKSNGGVVDGYIALAKGKDSSDDMAILPQQLKKLVEIAKQEDTGILEKITEEELYGTFKELTARQAETAIRNPRIISKILDERGRRGHVPENVGKSGLADRKYAGHVTEEEKTLRGMEENPSVKNDERSDLADDWNQKIDEFGTVPKGEKPARDIDVPNKIRRDRPISRFARTMMEAGVTPDYDISEFEKAILDGTMTHEVITDKKAEAKAISDIKYDGFKESLEAWDVLVRKGKIGKEELAFGMALYNQCVQNKDTRNAMKIAADLVAEATSAGQTLQACRMLKKMTPDGQLYYLEKSVQKMKEEFSRKLGDRFKGLELDDKLMEEYLTAEDEESRDYIYDRLCQDIADQMPSTLRDKWNSWRYLAMLGNPRTHIRNIVGNGIFTPVIRIKNFVAATVEAGAEKVGIIQNEERTKSIRKSKEAVAFAKEDFTKMVKVLQGQDAKYATTGDIESKRTIFKNKVLEFLRKKNFDFLEAEDMWFLKMHYVDALARAMTARKIDPDKASPKLLDELRMYAVEQAQIATYRDANSFADALTKIQRKANSSKSGLAKAGGFLLEGVMPFKKTPLNIAKQGVNYSPISIVKGIYKSFKKLQNGEAFSATEIIDDFAKGATGTGLMLLGFFLASQGMLTGAGDDEEKKRRFDKMTGEQTYAIKIGDSSYTIEWATPSCLPLFVGLEIYNLTNADGISTRQFFEAMTTLTDPLLELSVFSGVSDVLQTAQYEKMSAPFAIASEVATSYLLQGLPTVLGQFSRIIDPTKRNYYYDDKNSALPKVVQNFIGQAASKIPFASKLFEPSVDDWGREEKYGNLFERVAENLVSPGYYSKSNQTKVDREINRLYGVTGDASVFPGKQQKYYIDGDEKYNMTAEEYTEAKKTKGSVSFNLAERLIKGEMVLPKQEKAYGEMTDEEKVKAIKKCYELANDTTKATMLGKLRTKTDAHNLTKDEYKKYSADANVNYNKTSKYLNVIFSLPDYSADKRFARTIDSYARTYAEETALRDASKGKYKVSDWVATAESYGEDEGAAGYILWMAFEEAYGRDGAAEKLTDNKVADRVDIPEEVWEDVYISKSDASKLYEEKIDNSNIDLEKYMKALAFYSVTSGEKDENGKTITNSKKKKVAEFIRSQGWSAEEEKLIFEGIYKKGSVYDRY